MSKNRGNPRESQKTSAMARRSRPAALAPGLTSELFPFLEDMKKRGFFFFFFFFFFFTWAYSLTWKMTKMSEIVENMRYGRIWKNAENVSPIGLAIGYSQAVLFVQIRYVAGNLHRLVHNKCKVSLNIMFSQIKMLTSNVLFHAISWQQLSEQYRSTFLY